MKKIIPTFLLLCFLLIPEQVLAQEHVKASEVLTTQVSPRHSEQKNFHWEADIGLLASYSQSLIPSVIKEDKSISAIVVVSGGLYYKDFFIEASPLSGRPFTMGYTLTSNEKSQVNLIAKSLFFELSEEEQKQGNMLDGIQTRQTSMELGIEYFSIFKKYDVRFQYLHDALGRHKGNVASLEISRPIFTRHIMFVPGIAISYIDDRAANYYFGVSKQEETSFRKQYDAKASWFTTARMYLERPLSDDWSIVGSLGYTFVSSGINRSPLVQGRTHSYHASVGVLWTF